MRKKVLRSLLSLFFKFYGVSIYFGFFGLFYSSCM